MIGSAAIRWPVRPDAGGASDPVSTEVAGHGGG
jgi:hypothetical protein